MVDQINEMRSSYVIKLVKQQTKGVDTMFTWSWSSSIDGGTTLNQHGGSGQLSKSSKSQVCAVSQEKYNNYNNE